MRRGGRHGQGGALSSGGALNRPQGVAASARESQIGACTEQPHIKQLSCLGRSNIDFSKLALCTNSSSGQLSLSRQQLCLQLEGLESVDMLVQAQARIHAVYLTPSVDFICNAATDS